MTDSDTTAYSATGSCLCGKVQYKVTAPPQARFVCHCGHCKKASGSCFSSNWWYPINAYHITTGEDELRTFSSDQTNSGKPVTRSFCSLCGSPMWMKITSREEMKDVIVIPFGTLDGQDGLSWKPNMEFFVENRVEFLNPGIEGVKQVRVKQDA